MEISMKKLSLILSGLSLLISSVAIADETVGVATGDTGGNAFFYKEGNNFVIICTSYSCKKVKIKED